MHAHAGLVGDAHGLGQLVQGEVGSPSTHAEAIGGQVHGVGAETDGGTQLIHPPGGGQQLHRYAVGRGHGCLL